MLGTVFSAGAGLIGRRAGHRGAWSATRRARCGSSGGARPTSPASSRPGMKVALSGKVTAFRGRMQMENPEWSRWTTSRCTRGAWCPSTPAPRGSPQRLDPPARPRGRRRVRGRRAGGDAAGRRAQAPEAPAARRGAAPGALPGLPARGAGGARGGSPSRSCCTSSSASCGGGRSGRTRAARRSSRCRRPSATGSSRSLPFELTAAQRGPSTRCCSDIGGRRTDDAPAGGRRRQRQDRRRGGGAAGGGRQRLPGRDHGAHGDPGGAALPHVHAPLQPTGETKAAGSAAVVVSSRRTWAGRCGSTLLTGSLKASGEGGRPGQPSPAARSTSPSARTR